MTTPAHLGGHFGMTNTAPLVLDYICERHAPIRRMLDVGCGPGGMLDVAMARGILAVGVDGDPALTHDYIRQHDFTTGPWINGARYDLAWSVEFVEHVEHCFIGNVLTTFRLARVLLISHAVPGQGGHYHVNEQPSEHWRALLTMDGWSEDMIGTDWLRRHADDRYIAATGMLWTR